MVMISHIFQEEKLSIPHHKVAFQTFFQVLGASGFMALCSQIKIMLPFTFVPLTLQTLAVLLIGASLGSRKGAWALLLYFAEILMGLPVLSGGTSDPLVFLGPKGGYVLGFCLQAFLMGWFVERMTWSKPMTLLVGGLFSCAVEMGLGVCVLAHFVGWNHVWTMGFFPFIPGEILKVLFICFGFTSLKNSQEIGLMR
jgi:biotin transport system substrate-specific component